VTAFADLIHPAADFDKQVAVLRLAGSQDFQIKTGDVLDVIAKRRNGIVPDGYDDCSAISAAHALRAGRHHFKANLLCALVAMPRLLLSSTKTAHVGHQGEGLRRCRTSTSGSPLRSAAKVVGCGHGVCGMTYYAHALD